jgi:hypothetical protein
LIEVALSVHINRSVVLYTCANQPDEKVAGNEPLGQWYLILQEFRKFIN